MTYSVKLTDTAIQDLKEISFWIARQSKDVKIAKRFVGELKEKCTKLDIFPYSGAIPRDRVLKSMGYRFITHKDYLIFYTINEEIKTVYVMAIFNSKRDYMRVMRKFL